MFVILETDSVAAVVGGKAVAAVDYEIAAAVVDRLTCLLIKKCWVDAIKSRNYNMTLSYTIPSQLSQT